MQKITISEYLTREERKMLLQKSNWKAAFEIAYHWTWIVLAFGMVYYWTNLFTIVLAIFILGAKQLACAILMHDTGHRAVFKDQRINDFVGQWFGAYPIFQDMLKYRPYHNVHHIHTGSEEDPDLLLTRAYPTSRKSMMRKLFRDFTGQTGVKLFVGSMMLNLGYLTYNSDGQLVKKDHSQRSWSAFFKVLFSNVGKPIIANLIIFLMLSLIASPYLFILWIIAYFTTFQFVLRIRSMAEHSMVEDAKNPYQNTRTTYANWLERLLFAPYHVNYHVEHHLMMAVPSYNLPKMHELLKSRGFYEKGVLAKSYWRVFQMALQ